MKPAEAAYLQQHQKRGVVKCEFLTGGREHAWPPDASQGHWLAQSRSRRGRAVPWRGRAARRWLPGAAPHRAAAASSRPFASPVSPLKSFQAVVCLTELAEVWVAEGRKNRKHLVFLLLFQTWPRSAGADRGHWTAAGGWNGVRSKLRPRGKAQQGRRGARMSALFKSRPEYIRETDLSAQPALAL